ncbi:MAG TPA: hypothetical protein IAA57_00855 [Candidatus Pullilachnospira intestinigallinarum]|nr:hypothetical protein [Candidatus Pullilachnospira intestinigallinarum]
MRKQPFFVDRVIRFDSRQDRTSHPYQLEFAAGLIAREYSLLDSIKGKCQ